MPAEIVTLASIGHGSALELFEREMQLVIANIADVNTSAKAVREISIKVQIKPDEDRGIGFATLEVKSKLAGVKPISSTMYFGKKDGKFVAVSQSIDQPSIFDEEKESIQPLTAIQGGKQ